MPIYLNRLKSIYMTSKTSVIKFTSFSYTQHKHFPLPTNCGSPILLVRVLKHPYSTPPSVFSMILNLGVSIDSLGGQYLVDNFYYHTNLCEIN